MFVNAHIVRECVSISATCSWQGLALKSPPVLSASMHPFAAPRRGSDIYPTREMKVNAEDHGHNG